jgi:hypothetical protein
MCDFAIRERCVHHLIPKINREVCQARRWSLRCRASFAPRLHPGAWRTSAAGSWREITPEIGRSGFTKSAMVLNLLPWLLRGSERPEYALKQQEAALGAGLLRNVDQFA